MDAQTIPNNVYNKKNVFLLSALAATAFVIIALALINLNNKPKSNENALTPIATTVPEVTATLSPTNTPVITLAISPTITPTPTTNALKTFSSSHYNVSFSYPSALGNASAELTPDYYNNETVSFQNSEIYLSYWRYEGGDQYFETEKLISKDGKKCILNTYIIGAHNEEFALIAECDGNSTVDTQGFQASTSVVIMSGSLKNKDEVNKNKVIIKQIISTLQFDFHNVKI